MQLVAIGTLVAVVALLLAEWRGSRAAVWLCKPVASLGFITVAWLAGALHSGYGGYVLTGLCLCACGDVLLIPRANQTPFLLGIGSFVVGHVLYARAFYLRGTHWPTSVAAFAVMIVVVSVVLRWLRGHLPREMQLPVRVYMLVIASMVALASGASFATEDFRVGLGAIAFAASDLSVARERFVRPSLANLLWGLPLYYAAQLTLALTVP